ncbi:hypothetical protein VM98_38220, partial [Streptomyces rubellomurinus subsp. indigoferus]
ADSIPGRPEPALPQSVRRGRTLTRPIQRFPKPITLPGTALAYRRVCGLTQPAPSAVAQASAYGLADEPSTIRQLCSSESGYSRSRTTTAPGSSTVSVAWRRAKA